MRSRPVVRRRAHIDPHTGSPRWILISRFGAGASLPHPESTVAGESLEGYEWGVENHGVDPDIPVGEDPTALAKGSDPQLERAIKEVTDRMAKQPATPPRPAYERRVPKGGEE